MYTRTYIRMKEFSIVTNEKSSYIFEYWFFLWPWTACSTGDRVDTGYRIWVTILGIFLEEVFLLFRRILLVSWRWTWDRFLWTWFLHIQSKTIFRLSILRIDSNLQLQVIKHCMILLFCLISQAMIFQLFGMAQKCAGSVLKMWTTTRHPRNWHILVFLFYMQQIYILTFDHT